MYNFGRPIYGDAGRPSERVPNLDFGFAFDDSSNEEKDRDEEIEEKMGKEVEEDDEIDYGANDNGRESDAVDENEQVNNKKSNASAASIDSNTEERALYEEQHLTEDEANGDIDELEEEETPVGNLQAIQWKCLYLACSEKKVYERPRSFQDQGTLSTYLSSVDLVDSSLLAPENTPDKFKTTVESYLWVSGMLMSLVDGFPLVDLKENSPPEDWPKVLKTAVHVVNEWGDLGV